MRAHNITAMFKAAHERVVVREPRGIIERWLHDNKFDRPKEANKPITHTNTMKGAAHVPAEAVDEFYKILDKASKEDFSPKIRHGWCEIRSRIFRMYTDLDIIVDTNHESFDVFELVKIAQMAMKTFLPHGNHMVICLQTTVTPVKDRSGVFKYGIHLIWPEVHILVGHAIQFCAVLLHMCKNHFKKALPVLSNTWEDRIDIVPFKSAKGGLRMPFQYKGDTCKDCKGKPSEVGQTTCHTCSGLGRIAVQRQYTLSFVADEEGNPKSERAMELFIYLQSSVYELLRSATVRLPPGVVVRPDFIVPDIAPQVTLNIKDADSFVERIEQHHQKVLDSVAKSKERKGECVETIPDTDFPLNPHDIETWQEAKHLDQVQLDEDNGALTAERNDDNEVVPRTNPSKRLPQWMQHMHNFNEFIKRKPLLTFVRDEGVGITLCSQLERVIRTQFAADNNWNALNVQQIDKFKSGSSTWCRVYVDGLGSSFCLNKHATHKRAMIYFFLNLKKGTIEQRCCNRDGSDHDVRHNCYDIHKTATGQVCPSFRSEPKNIPCSIVEILSSKNAAKLAEQKQKEDLLEQTKQMQDKHIVKRPLVSSYTPQHAIDSYHRAMELKRNSERIKGAVPSSSQLTTHTKEHASVASGSDVQAVHSLFLDNMRFMEELERMEDASTQEKSSGETGKKRARAKSTSRKTKTKRGASSK